MYAGTLRDSCMSSTSYRRSSNRRHKCTSQICYQIAPALALNEDNLTFETTYTQYNRDRDLLIPGHLQTHALRPPFESLVGAGLKGKVRRENSFSKPAPKLVLTPDIEDCQLSLSMVHM